MSTFITAGPTTATYTDITPIRRGNTIIVIARSGTFATWVELEGTGDTIDIRDDFIVQGAKPRFDLLPLRAPRNARWYDTHRKYRQDEIDRMAEAPPCVFHVFKVPNAPKLSCIKKQHRRLRLQRIRT